ncbi:hypothetical protein PAMP_010010 [Pampus punctatissimus]
MKAKHLSLGLRHSRAIMSAETSSRNEEEGSSPQFFTEGCLQMQLVGGFGVRQTLEEYGATEDDGWQTRSQGEGESLKAEQPCVESRAWVSLEGDKL